MKIGDRINKIMTNKGLNYNSLSKITGYSDVQVRRICLNESVPKVDFIQHICSLFPDVDVEWLITGKSKKKTDKLSSDELEEFAITVFDNWEELMKSRLFKANFESKAASWALKLNKK